MFNLIYSENPHHYRSRWRSIRVLYFTIFLSSVGFSIIMPSVWPFLRILDPQVQTTFLGLVIGAFSLGQLAASPVIGALVNVLGMTGPPLVFGLAFQIIGNLMWCQLEDLPSQNGYLMICARILIGIGAANMAAIRAYVSRATTLRERTKANAFVSTCQALGFIIGPGLQAALVPLGYPGKLNYPGFRVNLYTAPGWLGALFSIINLIAIVLIFRDHSVEDEPELRRVGIQDSIHENLPHLPEDILESAANPNNESSSPSNSSASEIRVIGLDYIVITVFLILFFIILFIFVMFETILTPLSMYEYGWSKKEATMYMGIIWASTGVVTIFVVLLVSGPLQKFGERLLLLMGFAISVLGFVVYFPYSGSGPPIDWINGTHKNSSLQAFSAGADDRGGCPSNLKWCFELPQIHITQMLLAIFLLSIGYPTTNLLSSTIYSKILGSKPQGFWMGLFTASGSLARMFGPVYVGAVFQNFGPLATLGSGAGIAALGFFLVALVYKRIMPYSERKRRFEEARNIQC